MNAGVLSNYNLYQGENSEFDPISGWNRFTNRGNYDSRIGRWYSQDPSAQKYSTSQYAGMLNSPMNYTDPDGRIPILIIAAMVGALSNDFSHWDRVWGGIQQGNFVPFIDYSLAGAEGGIATIEEGPVAGIAVAGFLTVMADNSLGYAHGWDWKSFAEGGSSAIGTDDIAYSFGAAADKAGITDIGIEKLENETSFHWTKLELNYETEGIYRGGFYGLQGWKSNFVKGGLKNALKGFGSSNSSYGYSDFGLDFAIGGLQSFIKNPKTAVSLPTLYLKNLLSNFLAYRIKDGLIGKQQDTVFRDSFFDFITTDFPEGSISNGLW